MLSWQVLFLFFTNVMESFEKCRSSERNFYAPSIACGLSAETESQNSSAITGDCRTLPEGDLRRFLSLADQVYKENIIFVPHKKRR
jgi:hypothetical protein